MTRRAVRRRREAVDRAAAGKAAAAVRRDPTGTGGRLLTAALFASGALLFYEGFCLAGAGPRIVVEDEVYRVTLGVNDPLASHVLGAVFLVAAMAMVAALAWRHAGARWWRAVALGASGIAMVAIVVMLSHDWWSLGRASVEPRYVWCGTYLLMARQADFFYQVALLVWLGLSGVWVAAAGRRDSGAPMLE